MLCSERLSNVMECSGMSWAVPKVSVSMGKAMVNSGTSDPSITPHVPSGPVWPIGSKI